MAQVTYFVDDLVCGKICEEDIHLLNAEFGAGIGHESLVSTELFE